MREYIVRFLIAGIMALLVSLLFITGSHPQASGISQLSDKLGWKWPADGMVTDKYGTRQGKHKGIDIAGDLNTNVYSVDDGIVEKSYFSSTYGNVEFIKHEKGYVTVYAHLNKRLVTEGQRVRRGDLIGLMGTTGESTGVHLHFEVHESEWTFDKKFALDPEKALGEAHLGEVVQAGVLHKGTAALETISRLEEKSEQDLMKNENKVLTYIVSIGDTLWDIAKKNNTDVNDLLYLNHLSGANLYPGQKLLIHTLESGDYVVHTGDTLTSISEETKMPVNMIKQINNLVSDQIYPSQVLQMGAEYKTHFRKIQ